MTGKIKIIAATLTLIFATAAMATQAQSLEKTRTELAQTDNTSRASVNVKLDSDVRQVISEQDQDVAAKKIHGFRISIFRDNSQSAGENAHSVAARFKEKYPGVPVYVAYESPYFKVTAGNFITKLDAESFKGKLLTLFPKAVLAREDIPIECFKNQYFDKETEVLDE